MKICILTFQFAHNYGALLQAYALRYFLKQLGNDVSIVNYVPQKLKKEYSMNPFCYSRNPKIVISLTLRNLKRRKQNALFIEFQHNELGLDKVIYETKDMKASINMYDTVVVGSDQVWNTNITGEISNYFLDDGIVSKKVSYAASFGTDSINYFQISQIRKCLPRYAKISVRETKGIEILEENGFSAELICDPVFLLSKMDWENFERQPKTMKEYGRFVLLYGLENNDKLAEAAATYAREEGFLMFVIHPTAQKLTELGIQLYDVGPKEFVWLIHNAEKVYSNSFHASAFSVIFRKKLIYDAVRGLGSRVSTLFNSIGCQIQQGINEYDLSHISESNIQELANKGKCFLDNI